MSVFDRASRWPEADGAPAAHPSERWPNQLAALAHMTWPEPESAIVGADPNPPDGAWREPAGDAVAGLNAAAAFVSFIRSLPQHLSKPENLRISRDFGRGTLNRLFDVSSGFEDVG